MRRGTVMTSSVERAKRGSRAIGFHAGTKDLDPSLSLSELLCDLLVWSRREGVDFREALRRAVRVRDSEFLDAQLENWSEGDRRSKT